VNGGGTGAAEGYVDQDKKAVNNIFTMVNGGTIM
jgi:hypothetical protein